MNRFERVSRIIGFIFFGGFPIAVEGYGIGLITHNYGEYGQLALLRMIGVVLATFIDIDRLRLDSDTFRVSQL